MYYLVDDNLMQDYEPWLYRGSKDKYFTDDKYVLCSRLGPALRIVYTDLKTYKFLDRQPYCSVCGYMVYVGNNKIGEFNAGLLPVCSICYEGNSFVNEQQYSRQQNRN